MLKMRHVEQNDGFHLNNSWYLAPPANADSPYYTPAALSTLTAGQQLALLGNGQILGSPCSVSFKNTNAAAGTASFEIRGYNQFDETVVETVTWTALAINENVQTLWAYKQIVRVTVLSVTSSAAVLNIGTTASPTTGNATTRMRVAIPFRMRNWTIASGTSPQTDNNAEFIIMASTAGSARSAQVLDLVRSTVQFSTNIGGSVNLVRFNMIPAGQQ